MANILTNIVGKQTEANPQREAFFAPPLDGLNWRPVTWQQFSQQVNAAAIALANLGLQPKQCVAVFSGNRPECLVTDFAAYANRLATVSIYSTSSLDQVTYILNDCHAQVLFVGDDSQLAVALRALPDCPDLKKIIVYEPTSLLLPEKTEQFSSFINIQPTPELSRTVALRTAQADPADIATIIYTSGTTGEPKGAVLPHSCFNTALNVHRYYLTSLTEHDTSLSFLPMSHIFEKAWSYFCLYRGIRIYINLDTRAIQQALLQVRPTCMCSVPRFWEKVYTTIQTKLTTIRGPRKWFLNKAIATGRKRNLSYTRIGKKAPFLLELRYKFFHRMVLRPLQRLIGVENGNMFPTAGAPISPQIVEFFRSVGIPMVIGYGLSETTATVSCFPYVNYRIGTVGTPIPEVNVKIGPDNEILVKGPTVMREYLNKPQATQQAFTPDGWLRTGDAGTIGPDGAITLTDRIKDLFKTSNGKYIAPQAIESALSSDPLIEQIAVIGDRRKFVSALIVPAFPALKAYAQQHNIPFTDNLSLVENPTIRNLYAKHIEQHQAHLAPYERIKRFTLLPNEFTMEAGELTNTLKIKRPVINRRYADQINEMYL